MHKIIVNMNERKLGCSKKMPPPSTSDLSLYFAPRPRWSPPTANNPLDTFVPTIPCLSVCPSCYACFSFLRYYSLASMSRGKTARSSRPWLGLLLGAGGLVVPGAVCAAQESKHGNARRLQDGDVVGLGFGEGESSVTSADSSTQDELIEALEGDAQATGGCDNQCNRQRCMFGFC